MKQINALTIDLEEWYHSELVGGRRSSLSQAEGATRPLLKLLDQYDTKATFFVVGELAEKNPALIQSIFEKGHEIGCHTFTHQLVWNMSESLFREELDRFNSVVSKILGKIKMKGFRAPCFSIDNRNRWALRVLADFGYQYDSSIFPLKINPLYGVRGAPTSPYRISLEDVKQEDPHSPLMEFPFTPLKIGGCNIPISGGFYLRALPLSFLGWGLRRINQDQSFLVYIHPWEGFEETPRFKLPLYSRVISYYGITSVLRKFEYLLQHFKFTRMDQLLGLT